MRTLLALSLLLLPAAADERDDLRRENERLKALVERLSAQLEGTAKPINLARTNLARVTASSVNGGRSLANVFYGVLNLFDDGSHWHDNINYTSWLSNGEPSPWVEVRFDRPVTVCSVEAEGGPAYRVRLLASAGGESAPDPRGPTAGVAAVRVTFDAGAAGGNVQAREIRILGFPPEGIEVTTQEPRILLDDAHALKVARERFDAWKQALLQGAQEEVTPEGDSFVILFRRGPQELLRVRVSAAAVEEEPRADLAPRR